MAKFGNKSRKARTGARDVPPTISHDGNTADRDGGAHFSSGARVNTEHRSGADARGRHHGNKGRTPAPASSYDAYYQATNSRDLEAGAYAERRRQQTRRLAIRIAIIAAIVVVVIVLIIVANL
jgi:hypothetical protein